MEWFNFIDKMPEMVGNEIKYLEDHVVFGVISTVKVSWSAPILFKREFFSNFLKDYDEDFSNCEYLIGRVYIDEIIDGKYGDKDVDYRVSIKFFAIQDFVGIKGRDSSSLKSYFPDTAFIDIQWAYMD